MDSLLHPPLGEIAPLLHSYLAYFQQERLPYTIPGHKQRAGRLDHGLGVIVDSDLPLYGGLDEIKQTNGTLKAAERLAATLWGAGHARFSTGGSTHANQAIILALGKPGDTVLLSRTSHRSVLSALVLAGLEPVWLAPEIDAATGVPTGVPVQELRRALSELPRSAPGRPPAAALLLTEPGYLGTLSDLRALVAEAHLHDIPVVVDAAWGGHFGFAPGRVPEHCLLAGADALVTSVHKALPGYSASAMLLVQPGRISLARVDQAFETTHTTSPAGAPLASIDGVRALLATRGHELLSALVRRVEAFKIDVEMRVSAGRADGGDSGRRRLFLGPEDFAPGRFDPTKVVLRVGQLGHGVSGVAIERALLHERIRVELADADTIVFIATLCDGDDEFKRLADVLVRVLHSFLPPANESSSLPRPRFRGLSCQSGGCQCEPRTSRRRRQYRLRRPWGSYPQTSLPRTLPASL
jgi:arginine decarboxylase